MDGGYGSIPGNNISVTKLHKLENRIEGYKYMEKIENFQIMLRFELTKADYRRNLVSFAEQKVVF